MGYTERQKIEIIKVLKNVTENIQNIRENVSVSTKFTKYLQGSEFNILFAIEELKGKG